MYFSLLVIYWCQQEWHWLQPHLLWKLIRLKIFHAVSICVWSSFPVVTTCHSQLNCIWNAIQKIVYWCQAVLHVWDHIHGYMCQYVRQQPARQCHMSIMYSLWTCHAILCVIQTDLTSLQYALCTVSLLVKSSPPVISCHMSSYHLLFHMSEYLLNWSH